MAQTRNRFDIQNNLNEKEAKQLPNFFDTQDELKPLTGIGLSVLAHIVFSILLIIVTYLQGLFFHLLPKPELPNRNIEFKLVQKESKPPINKNTKIRSDRDSQAGGKHDPKKMVSEPNPSAQQQKKSIAKQAPAKQAPAKQTPKVAQKQTQKQVQKPIQKPVEKQVQKPVQKNVEQTQKVVNKPTPLKPIQAKPTVKPINKATGVSAPSAPKIVSTPKSPFAIATPTTKSPVGTTYKPAGTPSVQSGGSSGQSAPAPKFSSSGSSASRGSSGSSGSSGNQYASRGSYGGYGNPGNPSPGNPNGAPGIDAIKQPNWGPYMRDLEQRIKRNWSPPKGDSSKRVVINFTIGRDGRLLSHRVTKSSGVPLADRAAMSAIELTAPFRPLPPEFRGQSVAIEFTFDYNVLNSILR